MMKPTILLSLTVAAAATPILNARQSSSSSNISIVDAYWDGSCFYPKPDDDFDLSDYLGRWYQLAGTVAPFTEGCTCTFAEYSLNDNGTVNVLNSCLIGDQSISIVGTATPADEDYAGDDDDGGAFRVQFPMESEPECPGPNYIVQAYDDDDGFAIVQAANFSTLFLLSRRQVVEERVVDRWLARAERLGSNLTEVVKTNQTGCVFTQPV